MCVIHNGGGDTQNHGGYTFVASTCMHVVRSGVFRFGDGFR